MSAPRWSSGSRKIHQPPGQPRSKALPSSTASRVTAVVCKESRRGSLPPCGAAHREYPDRSQGAHLCSLSPSRSILSSVDWRLVIGLTPPLRFVNDLRFMGSDSHMAGFGPWLIPDRLLSANHQVARARGVRLSLAERWAWACRRLWVSWAHTLSKRPDLSRARKVRTP